VRFVVFPVWVFHVKICVLVLRLIYFYLRGFITSGIRAQGFKIDLLSGRLSAALPGSTVQHRFGSAAADAASSSFNKIEPRCGFVRSNLHPIYKVDTVLAAAAA
jgi:hypothetical protein